MNVGDIVINPYVRKEFKGKPNPMYKSMVIHIGKRFTTCLRIDGEICDYETACVTEYEIAGHVDLEQMILGTKVKDIKNG